MERVSRYAHNRVSLLDLCIQEIPQASLLSAEVEESLSPSPILTIFNRETIKPPEQLSHCLVWELLRKVHQVLSTQQ